MIVDGEARPSGRSVGGRRAAGPGDSVTLSDPPDRSGLRDESDGRRVRAYFLDLDSGAEFIFLFGVRSPWSFGQRRAYGWRWRVSEQQEEQEQEQKREQKDFMSLL